MRRCFWIALGFLLLSVWGASPAQAQIVSYLAPSGKRIFINANPAPDLQRNAEKASKATPSAPKSPAFHAQLAAGAAAPNQPVPETSHEEMESMISEVSSRYQVAPALIRAVIQTESNWNPTAISTKGAQGLMQLIPTTAHEMGVSNAFDPKQNLEGGVRYLRMLLGRYNGDLDRALAAYNAGPGAVDRAGGVPRIRETREYVQKVTSAYGQGGGGAVTSPRPIYRTVSADGRVVFTNE